jgi:uncharacterized membrane protein
MNRGFVNCPEIGGFNRFNSQEVMQMHMFGGLIFMCMFIIFAIVAVVIILKVKKKFIHLKNLNKELLKEKQQASDNSPQLNDNSLIILNERLAKGEVSVTDYEAIKQVLTGKQPDETAKNTNIES